MAADKSKLARLVLLVTLCLAGCADGDGPSCARLADHEAALLLDALPLSMQARAREGMGEQRAALLAACERDRPSEARARCELASSDLESHRRCRPDFALGDH